MVPFMYNFSSKLIRLYYIVLHCFLFSNLTIKIWTMPSTIFWNFFSWIQINHFLHFTLATNRLTKNMYINKYHNVFQAMDTDWLNQNKQLTSVTRHLRLKKCYQMQNQTLEKKIARSTKRTHGDLKKKLLWKFLP